MFKLMVSDWGILFATLVVLISLSRFYRSSLEAMLLDRDLTYRLISRISVGVLLFTLLWVTALDNWRQILGVLTRYTHDERRANQSDPFFTSPPDDIVRWISYILIFGSILGGAYLFARYARGYWGPLVFTPVAIALYYIFNAFRLRLDVDSVRIADQNITGLWEILSTLTWIVAIWAMFVLLIISAYAMLWGPTALVVSLIYRNTVGKIKYEEPDMFRKMSERNESSQAPEQR